MLYYLYEGALRQVKETYHIVREEIYLILVLRLSWTNFYNEALVTITST